MASDLNSHIMERMFKYEQFLEYLYYSRVPGSFS